MMTAPMSERRSRPASQPIRSPGALSERGRSAPIAILFGVTSTRHKVLGGSYFLCTGDSWKAVRQTAFVRRRCRARSFIPKQWGNSRARSMRSLRVHSAGAECSLITDLSPRCSRRARTGSRVYVCVRRPDRRGARNPLSTIGRDSASISDLN